MSLSSFVARSGPNTCAYFVSFSCAVPQLLFALPPDPRQRAALVDPSQETWLIQYLSKDFLNLVPFGGMGFERSVAGSSSHGPPYGTDNGSFRSNPTSEYNLPSSASSSNNVGAGGGGGGGSSRPSGGDILASVRSAEDGADGSNQWLKSVTIDQLGISATSLYFFFYDDTNTRHSFMVCFVTPNTLALKLALPSLCDRLTCMYDRVTGIFEGVEDLTAVTGSAGAAHGGSSSQIGGGGDGPFQAIHNGDYTFNNSDSTNQRALLGADATAALGGGGGPSFGGMEDAFGGGSIAGGTDGGDLGYHDLWRRELESAIPDVGFWVSGVIDRSTIPLKRTLVDELRRASPPVFEIMRGWLEQLVTIALSEQRVIFCGDVKSVELVLHTVALFLPDDRLMQSSLTCFPNAIIADLNMQGTTLPVEKVQQRLLWFRYPAAVVDVRKFASLEKPVHMLPVREGGKKVCTVFREWRRRQLRHIKSIDPAGFYTAALAQDRVVSPIVTTIVQRFINLVRNFPNAALSTTSVPQSPAGLMSHVRLSNLSARMLSTVGSSSAGPSNAPHFPAHVDSVPFTPASDATTFKSMDDAALHHHPSPATVAASPPVSAVVVAAAKAAAASGSGSGGGGGLDSSTSSPPHALSNMSFAQASAGDGYNPSFYHAVMFSLHQWRRSLVFRALAFHVAEVDVLTEERDRPAPLRQFLGDLHVLLTCVEYLHPVAAHLEEKTSQLLSSNMYF